MRRLIVSILFLSSIVGFSAVMAQQVHVVQRGDNLSSIARRYGSTLQEVAQANGISAPYIIHAGNQITIPAPGGASAQTQLRPQTSAQTVSTAPTSIDNCCFVDRQCNSDQQWEDGYWAFQNGQCPVPAQTQIQTSTQPISKPPAQINNCCFLDRQCVTEEDWEEGWRAWGRLECASLIDNCCQIGWECHTEADWQIGDVIAVDVFRRFWRVRLLQKRREFDSRVCKDASPGCVSSPHHLCARLRRHRAHQRTHPPRRRQLLLRELAM